MAEAEGYDVGVICENGHWINAWGTDSPQYNTPFCSDCGAAAIRACPGCGVPIRGNYRSGGLWVDDPPRPRYCHACGQPYPWTAKSLAAAQELAGLLEGVTPEQIEALRGDMLDIVRETPRTETAVLRLKRTLQTATVASRDAFLRILEDVASEAAKRALFGE